MMPHEGNSPGSHPTSPRTLNVADVRRVAALARLDLTDNEAARLATELGGVLAMAESLAAFPLDGVEPMSHPTDARSVLAADVPADGFDPSVVTSLSPSSNGPFITVPKVLGGGSGGA